MSPDSVDLVMGRDLHRDSKEGSFDLDCVEQVTTARVESLDCQVEHLPNQARALNGTRSILM